MKTYICFKNSRMYGSKDEVEFVTHSLEKAKEYASKQPVHNLYESHFYSYREVPLL